MRIKHIQPVVTLLAVMTAIPAIAATPFKDAAGSVHIQDGYTASQKVSLELTGTPVTKSVKYNQCGLVTIGNPSTSVLMPATITVAGNAVTVASLPLQVTPKCVLNATSGAYSLATPAPANFRTVTGQVVMVGGTPNAAVVVGYDGINKMKSVSANACGFVKLGTTALPAPANFKLDGIDYVTDSLPVQVPSRCIKGVKYVAQP